MVIRQIGPGMIQQAQVTCTACKGSGSQIADKDRCPECLGQKTIKEKKTLEIHVTKGMAHGAKIVFSGEADQAVSCTPPLFSSFLSSLLFDALFSFPCTSSLLFFSSFSPH